MIGLRDWIDRSIYGKYPLVGAGPSTYMTIVISTVQDIDVDDDGKLIELRDDLSPVSMALEDTFKINFFEPGTKDPTSAIIISFDGEGQMLLRTYNQELARKRERLEQRFEIEELNATNATEDNAP